MDWLNIASSVSLLVVLILAYFRINNLEKRIEKIEEKIKEQE